MRTGQNLYERARRRIPGGAQLLGKRPEQFLPGNWPAYYSRAAGCTVWDLDGQAYADFTSNGIGTCLLGYADPVINAAVTDCVQRGTMCTLNSPAEVDLAELLCTLHPWEEYYGRHRNTAPAREMVPFELAWLAELFGEPRAVIGDYRRGRPEPASFEDTWNLQLQLPEGAMGQMTVTMGCAADVRRGTAVGTEGAIHWDVNRGEIILQKAGGVAPQLESFGPIGRNIEQAYAAEIGTFVDAAFGRGRWPYGYAGYQHSIATLAAAEASARTRQWTLVDPQAEPTTILAPLAAFPPA